MTNGQSASLSWCQSLIWGPRPDFLLMWGALSDERMDHLQLLLASASTVNFRSMSRGTHDHILLSEI
jgi:hypothetical protein